MRLGALVFPNVCPGCEPTDVWYAPHGLRLSLPSRGRKPRFLIRRSQPRRGFPKGQTPVHAGVFLRLMGDGTRMPAMAPIKADATSGAPNKLATSCVAPTAWWNWASCWAAI